jgi:hypothetical protein
VNPHHDQHARVRQQQDGNQRLPRPSQTSRHAAEEASAPRGRRSRRAPTAQCRTRR